MKSNHITQAIEDLRAEEAAAKVKPVYKKMTKLVNGTKVGEAIRYATYNQHTGEFQSWQFCFHWTDDEWQYGNDDDCMNTDQIIAQLVRESLNERTSKPERLTVEKKGK